MIEHPRDDLAAFALGALDENEQRLVEAHVTQCSSCTAETDTYRHALIAYAAGVDTSSPQLRAGIVARAHSTVGARRATSWLGALTRPVPAFVSAALALLLVASVAGLAQARRESDAYAAALSGIPGARVVSLQPPQGASDVRGSVVIPESGAAYVVLRVPSPPAGRSWEAWVLRGDQPVRAGLTLSGGVVTITLTAPLGAGDGVAVTLEPSAGSDAPTTAPVLAVPRT